MVSFAMPVVALFVPGSRPERFAKADGSGADAVILDLEDAVSATDKDRARDAVISAAAKLRSPVIVRVNGRGTPWHAADVDALRHLDGVSIMLSKAEHPEDIAEMTRSLGRKVSVIALIESAVGLVNLSGILTSPGVEAAAFGSLDFSLDIGCAHDRLALVAARSEIVWRSRAANRAAPIDGVTVDLGSPEVVEDDARHSVQMGFGGKMAIHPKQIDPIGRAFRPSEGEIAWASDAVNAAASGGVARFKDAMVDRPIIERANRILRRAAATQERKADGP